VLTFAVPGLLDQTTGGYLFDRHLVDGARALGREVRVVELAGRFPDADDAARAGAAHSLVELPDASHMIIDGLALPAYENCIDLHAARLKLIGLIHHPVSLETGLSISDAARYAKLETQIWHRLRGFVCPSQSTARAISAAGVDASRIFVVPPGTGKPASLARGSMDGTVRLLSVGMVAPRKGQDILIAALASLRHLDWRLVCIGSLTRHRAYADAVRTSIQALGLDKRITMAGELPAHRVALAYASADVFVLPSYHEGYGMAYAEALAHGLPVIATRAGAIAETVPVDAALFVEPGDVEGLRRTLILAIEDADLRRRLAGAAATAGAALPGWSETTKRWLAAIDTLTQ